MPYIILLVLVIAIVVVAVRKQKYNQSIQQIKKTDKANDIYVTAEENKDYNDYDNQ